MKQQQDAMARPNPRSRPQGNDPRNNGRSRPSQGPASYAGSSTRTRPTDPGLAAAMAAEDRARQEYAQEVCTALLYSLRPFPPYEVQLVDFILSTNAISG